MLKAILYAIQTKLETWETAYQEMQTMQFKGTTKQNKLLFQVLSDVGKRKAMFERSEEEGKEVEK